MMDREGCRRPGDERKAAYSIYIYICTGVRMAEGRAGYTYVPKPRVREERRGPGRGTSCGRHDSIALGS